MHPRLAVFAAQQLCSSRITDNLFLLSVPLNARASFVSNHCEFDGGRREISVLRPAAGLLAGAHGIEELDHVQAAGIGFGLMDLALFAFAARNAHPAVVRDENGF